MNLAQKSGLLHVNIGLESIDPGTLGRMNKKMNISDHEIVLRDLRRRGISYSLNFIFGSDSDPEDIFEKTLSFLIRNKVPAAYLNILTPHKRSSLYDRLTAEGRIVDSDGIGRWPGMSCHIRLRNLFQEKLVWCAKDLQRKFYNWRSMLVRLPPPFSRTAIASWIINLTEKNSFQNGAENFSRL